jgi:hypothetical protein
VLLEVFGHGLGILHMALHSQAEGFEPLQEQPGIEGRLAGADVAQNLHARLGDEAAAPRSEISSRDSWGRSGGICQSGPLAAL